MVERLFPILNVGRPKLRAENQGFEDGNGGKWTNMKEIYIEVKMKNNWRELSGSGILSCCKIIMEFAL